MAAKSEQEHFFIVHDDEGKRGFILDKPIYSIGRGDKCHICLHSKLYSSSLSRHHATLIRQSREDGSYFYRIIDGDTKGKASVNGLRINGQKVPSRELTNGDEIFFGPHVLAIYELRGKDNRVRVGDSRSNDSSGDDPYDITLIDPSLLD